MPTKFSLRRRDAKRLQNSKHVNDDRLKGNLFRDGSSALSAAVIRDYGRFIED